MRYFMVGLGGVFGALARYGASLLLNDKGVLPWGTLAVNLAGCFLLAFFLTLVLNKFSGHSYIVLAVSTGFIGSFTTFSTISVESISLTQSSALLGPAYLTLTLAGGYMLTWAGYSAGLLILATGWGERWAGLAGEGRRND
ncbi:CrcB family protein [Desulfallas sp. Bu1-1]|uniref:fluoride efflux transporter FluC n=1 Tax=Desulfallas sp. Bu1-1 TaxID=2787620 RepID=UPI00189E4254|nr:CrcB family protein [Desulfallas sp. Bu1-1]MBF7082540.1 CrcB family protein [Desulfallas sp. Bu1-1]